MSSSSYFHKLGQFGWPPLSKPRRLCARPCPAGSRALCGEVDPVRHRKCGTRSRADSIQVETALVRQPLRYFWEAHGKIRRRGLFLARMSRQRPASKKAPAQKESDRQAKYQVILNAALDPSDAARTNTRTVMLLTLGLIRLSLIGAHLSSPPRESIKGHYGCFADRSEDREVCDCSTSASIASLHGCPARPPFLIPALSTCSGLLLPKNKHKVSSGPEAVTARRG